MDAEAWAGLCTQQRESQTEREWADKDDLAEEEAEMTADKYKDKMDLNTWGELQADNYEKHDTVQSTTVPDGHDTEGTKA